MKRILISVLAVVLSWTVFNTDPAQAYQLVDNGGFETGDFTGWSLSGDISYSGIGESVMHTGDYGFYSGSLEGNTYLEQVVQTAPGQEHTLSFWMSRDAQVNPFEEPLNSFMVFWDGGWDPVFELQNFSEQNYEFYSLSLQAVNAESLLSFYFFDSQSFINLDDVSMTTADISPVPVPGTLALLASGLVGLAGLRKKRSRA